MNQDQGKEKIYFFSGREKKNPNQKGAKTEDLSYPHRKKKVSQRFRAVKSQANKARKKTQKASGGWLIKIKTWRDDKVNPSSLN